MNNLFSSILLMIMFHGFFQPAMAVNGANQENILIEDQLPLTGDPRIDDAFKQKVLKLYEGLDNTEPLTKKQAKRYDDLNAALGLDQSDLRLIAKGLAAPKGVTNTLRASAGSTSSGNIPGPDLISPDSIKTMPLGASIWASQSLFARRSIFDMGVLRGLSLIPNLQGSTESGLASKVSSRVDKNSNSEKFSLDMGAALRLGGFQASVGYKRDTATEKTSMGGKATASIYNYATNTFRIEPKQGLSYWELKGALKGVNLGGKAGSEAQADPNEIFKYISVSELKVNPDDPKDPSTYKHITVIDHYFDKSSPRAHIQALSLLENYFTELSQEYQAYSKHTPKSQPYAIAAQSLYSDMSFLKIEINGTIKRFYENWGDNFVSEITGYSEIQGEGKLVQTSGSANSEVNNAGTLTTGFSNFIWAAETSVSVSDWAKNASAYGASEITTNIYQRPNNGVDLSGYNTALMGWLNTAVKDNGNAAALPAVAIQPTLPKLPTTRPWQDDPFAPPKEVKEWKDWKESREAFKDSKFVSVPDWLKRRREEQGAPPVNAQDLRIIIADEANGGDGRRDNEEFFSFAYEEVQLAEGLNIRANPLNRNGFNAKSYAGRSSLSREYTKNIKQELRYLKAEGKKQRAADRIAWKKLKYFTLPVDQSVVPMAATPNDGDNELFMDKMLVSGFKTLPLATVLEALRPKLDIPALPENYFDAFVNTSVLLAYLNKFNTIDTYINFISSIPESGLQRTSIPANFHEYVSHLQEEIMIKVQGSMSSGQDLSSVDMVTLLNDWIYGLDSGGNSYVPKKTKLFEYLKNNLDYYNYIFQLSTPENFRVIGKAPGGYLPLARRNARSGGGYCVPRISEIGQFGVRTTYNSQPRYLGNSDCMEVNASTDIPRLLAGNPQTPLYPLFIYAEKTQPMLNFVQFVGGSRLIIGRDITLAPPVVGDLTAVPKQGIPAADAGILGSMGYKPTLLGDPVLLKLYITDKCNNRDCFSDQRLQQPETLNAFLPSDISWNYSLWFQDNQQSSIDGYEHNQILIARLGMYAAAQKLIEQSSGGNDYYGRGGTPLCNTNAYCPVLTYQFMAPYSYQVNYSLPNWGLGKVSLPPKDSYLAWSDGIKDRDNNYKVNKVSLFDVGNSSGTKYTGGLLILYPITNAMLEGAGSAGFTYSSGSSPKDIFNQDDAGNSPFDAGFTRALLQQ